ncbi:plasmid partitioning protein RepB C-terminal domain-containing protein [Bradyrhizobium sp. Mp27]|uniref:plasmid partitioning protein RepB C-terminal domain-containing protein n=1 Tax=Bradyrhizobium sp. Mp27 TaxID=3042157 RepID=UPI00248B8847|nr:plasmid partitioning protein RepB C-terminal domain-containing protein [Bradyrhizobium sp. Mp27]MDI2071235.1 plasmid partitioning protein RepB C-terminal domain-containing protein [Bradyrhizobium sp. Mp27]
MARRPHISVRMGFEERTSMVRLSDIQPLKLVSEEVKRSPKYRQIAASVGEIGLVEPPVVARSRDGQGKFLLLDGHLRLEVLRERGQLEIECLISTEDEAFTYNKRVNRIAIIQEHRMILKAIENGVSEARIAKALNVDVASIRRRRKLLDGICTEAVDLLKEKHLTLNSFSELRKLAPIRQIEAAELMIAMNNFSNSYVRSLVAATPRNQLATGYIPRAPKGLSDEQLALMERESASLAREFKVAEQTYGTDHLDLALAVGYVSKLLRNGKVVGYLAKHFQELLFEFQRITESEANAA